MKYLKEGLLSIVAITTIICTLVCNQSNKELRELNNQLRRQSETPATLADNPFPDYFGNLCPPTEETATYPSANSETISSDFAISTEEFPISIYALDGPDSKLKRDKESDIIILKPDTEYLVKLDYDKLLSESNPILHGKFVAKYDETVAGGNLGSVDIELTDSNENVRYISSIDFIADKNLIIGHCEGISTHHLSTYVETQDGFAFSLYTSSTAPGGSNTDSCIGANFCGDYTISGE